MSNTKFIVFSGGCHSGKTTTMTVVKEILEKQDIKVVMLNEIVRKHDIESIDELRKNGHEYFNFQEKVILEKMNQESALFASNEKCVVLCDRAITDSLFYLLYYTDKSTLTKEDHVLMNRLYKSIDAYAKTAFTNIYTCLFEFMPLPYKQHSEYDKFRPVYVMHNMYMEHALISILNESYNYNNINCCSNFKINLNKYDELERVQSLVYSFLISTKILWNQTT